MYFHSFTSMLLTLLFITLSRHMGGHIRALDYIHTMKIKETCQPGYQLGTVSIFY